MICDRGFVTRWRVSGSARGDSVHFLYLLQVYALFYDSTGTHTHTHTFTRTHIVHVHECDKSPTLVRQPCVKLCSDCSSSRFVTNASAHSDAHEVHRAVLVALVFYKVHRCFVYVIFSSGFRRAGRVGNRLFAE